MRKSILLFALLFGAISFASAQTQTDSITKSKSESWWHKTFGPRNDNESKKGLRNQRDSLLLVINNLYEDIDSLTIKNDSLTYETQFSDSLNLGATAIDSIYSGVIQETGKGNTDSLINVWYEHKTQSYEDALILDLDDSNITSNIPDSIYMERLKQMNLFISVPYNENIRKHIIAYTERNRSTLERVLGLAPYYMPQFEEIFEKHDLPIELTAMAIIESALNPVAVSSAKARGMWQFMYSTAKMYGLTINSYIDERYDPIKSGYAAAKYLMDSYKIYGDWALAISSYNCGIGNVNKAIRRANGSKDFWKVYPYLPRETRGYVPAFFAALYTMNYYKEHNMTPKAVSFPNGVDTIKVNKMLHFDQITHFTGISPEELKDLNPQYLHNIIPGTDKEEYILKLPYEYINKFIDSEKEIYTFNKEKLFNAATLKSIQNADKPSRIIHKVKSGETVGHIALKYRVKVSDIQRWNNVKTYIRIGQKLIIYTNGGPSYSSSSKSTTVSKGYVTYTVKNGESLWLIAKKFKIPFNDLLKINGMSKKSKIYPGMKIKIRKN